MILDNIKRFKSLRPCALALILTALAASTSFAADVYLVAKEFTKTLPDSTNVTMWGFADDLDGDLTTNDGEIPTVPGPTITVSPADATLTIHVRNDLTAESTSIIIPGQAAAMTPSFFTDGQGRERVFSLTHETPVWDGIPGSYNNIGSYTWSSLKPGTYIYESGTHPAVQVQMGLYGCVKKDAAANEAYASTATVDANYDAEVVLFFSEIDPALHAAVQSGTYGTVAYPSTINYKPKYFLVNGEPYSAGQLPLSAGTAGDRLLIRCLNAGLRELVPSFYAQDMQVEDPEVIAQDGNLYPFARKDHSTLLPAGQTRDVVFVANTAGTFVVYDRRGSLTSNEAPYGGMLVHLEVGP
jgi:FtsP/CotA-like multicopper oxidase with cupredoxin domain